MNTGIQVVKEMSSKFSYSGLFASILVCVCVWGGGGGGIKNGSVTIDTPQTTSQL